MPIKNAAEKESEKELKEKDKEKTVDKNNNVKKLGTSRLCIIFPDLK